jgi:integrase
MKAGDGLRKKGGKWTARWTDVHGQRRETTLEARTRTEAREKRAQLVAKTSEQRLGIWQGDAQATFADVWKDYKPLAETLAGWRTISWQWRIHLEPEFGSKRLQQVSKRDVQLFLINKEKKEGLAPRTCDHLRIRLGALFNFAASEGIYRGKNVASEIGPLDVPESEPRTLPFEIVQAVIDAVPTQWRSFFALAVYTGLRSGELRALRHESISPDWRELRVSRSGARRTTKTKKARAVAIPRAALPYLEAALKASKGMEWVFVTATGKQLPRHIKPPDILRAALEKLGLVDSWTGWCTKGCKTRELLTERKPWRCPKCGTLQKVQPNSPFVFHDLRKTWETHMHDVVNDPMSVFQMAGHSPAVAMRNYIGRNARRLGAKADLLDFKNPSPSFPRTATEVDGEQGETDEQSGTETDFHGGERA